MHPLCLCCQVFPGLGLIVRDALATSHFSWASASQLYVYGFANGIEKKGRKKRKEKESKEEK